LAGKREGLGGEKSGLITEAIRLIKECRPSFFIWENVKGTFSSNSGADFWAIIQAFTNIGGYRLEWQLLNTKWFLPQNRERIYLVGCLRKGSGRQIFPITENYRQIDETRANPNTCTLTTRYKASTSLRVKTNNKKGYEIAVEGDTINYQNLKSTTRRGRVGKQIAQTLDSGGEQAVIGYSRDAKGKVTNYHTKYIANTLHSSTGGGGNTDQYILNKSIRRLTPIECERLQGFPDDWTRYGQELNEISDSQRYKMCGNAVTVDVVEAVAKKIKEALKS